MKIIIINYTYPTKKNSAKFVFMCHTDCHFFQLFLYENRHLFPHY